MFVKQTLSIFTNRKEKKCNDGEEEGKSSLTFTFSVEQTLIDISSSSKNVYVFIVTLIGMVAAVFISTLTTVSDEKQIQRVANVYSLCVTLALSSHSV